MDVVDDGTDLAPLPVRAGQVFFSPSAVFDQLATRPVWFGAAALGAVMALVGVVAIPGEVWEEFFRARMLASGQAVPEGVAGGGNLFRIFGTIGALIFWFVWLFVVSGFATVVFAFVLGDDIKYRQVLSGVSHAFLIAAMGGLLTLPLKIAQRDPQLTLSIGTFLPMTDGYLAALLSGLDLFSLWAFVVLGVAMSRFDRRRSAGSAATILIAFFVGMMAFFAIFQA